MPFEQPSLATFQAGEHSQKAAENSNPDNWEWCVESTKIWQLAAEVWQEFNTKWYGSQCIPLHDPKSPSLSLGPLSALGNFPSEILVRECYGTMFDRVWAKAMTSGGKIGSLITGQPGTGKTLLLIDLLVRFLQLRQVVLFTLDGQDLYLFYHGKVYITTVASLNTTQKLFRLPQPKSQTSQVFIWSLFDIQKKQEPDSVLITHPCLPVQAASPDPIRFKIWRKEFKPMPVGLPLWTRDELTKGLPYQSQYNSFLDALRKDPSQYKTDPLQPFPGARGLLAEFQEHAADMAADMAAADGMILMDTDMDVTSPLSEALDYILGAAIDRFGYSARDVFDAIFDCESSTTIHEAAFVLTPTQLEEAFSFLADNQVSSTQSHMIVALSPVCTNPYTDDRWKVNFKSPWVAKSITQRLHTAADKEVRKQLSFLQRIPQAGGLEGYLFEPFIHRSFTEKPKENGHFRLFSMASDGGDSPRFLMDRTIPVTVRLTKVKRRVVAFETVVDLSMDQNIYYIPASTDFPLFDAFTMEIDLSKGSAVVWVLQVTISRSHGGSSRGYQKIRSIMTWLKQQLKLDGQSDSPPCVEVRYILVVTKGESNKLEWRFPKGWNVSCVRNDHRGSVYCVEVDLTRCF